jgi:hypothetical protein
MYPIKISFKKNELLEIVSEIEEICHIDHPDNEKPFVVSIRKNTFKNAKNLEKLATLGCLVEKDTFDQMNLQSLDLLDLDWKQDREEPGGDKLFGMIPPKVNLLEAVSCLKNLKKLGLGCESLQKIDQNSFASHTKLKLLNLSFNNELKIDQNTFKNMESLVILGIEHCSLKSIQG